MRAALVIGAARRALRSREASPLPPIRTLHYFVTVLDEVFEVRPAQDYVEYLEARLFPLAEAKAEASAHIDSG